MTKLIFRNLFRNKRRTFLTTASVALAIFVLTMLSSVLQAMTNVGDVSEARRLVARNAISLTFAMPEAYGQRLASIPHVVGVTPLQWFQGVYKDNRPANFFPRFATDPETLFTVFPEIVITPEEVEAWKSERSAFIAGKKLADEQGWKLGDVITIKGDIFPVNPELVLRAIFTVPDNETSERMLYFHRRYLEEALGNPGQVGTYWMLIDEPKNAPEVIETAEAMFENSSNQVRAETEAAFALAFVQMLGNVSFLFLMVGSGIVISILLITANTMAMAARERTREVAVLRTLGFRRKHVVSMVVLEAVAVGLAGAVLGLAVAGVVNRGVGSVLEGMGMFAFGQGGFDPVRLAQGLGLGLLLGVVAGAFPAYTAARLKIVDGLRAVG
jgi:putative ABC transport system permease protein